MSTTTFERSWREEITATYESARARLAWLLDDDEDGAEEFI